MISIFYIIIGILVIAVCVIFFYRNKNITARLVIASEAKQSGNSNVFRQEPVIRLDIIDDREKDDEEYFTKDIVVHDPAEEEQAVIINKEAEELDNTDIILLQIKALSDRPYSGYELLQALTAADLTFGKRGIFHGNNFSVAAATIEGSFPVDSMGSFKCLGLMVFMKLNPKKKLMMTFDLMLDTARQLAEELGGEIYDDLNQPINVVTIKRLREKICTIEKRESHLKCVNSR